MCGPQDAPYTMARLVADGTVGGYITNELGRIPPRGTAVRWGEWVIQVYDADERRVQEVSLQFLGKLAKHRHRRHQEAAHQDVLPGQATEAIP